MKQTKYYMVAFALLLTIFSITIGDGQPRWIAVAVNAVIPAEPIAAVPSPVGIPTFPPRTVKTIKWNESACGDSRLKNDHNMILVSREEVLHYTSKYWSGQDLEIATALSLKEGQRDLSCVADEMLYFNGRQMYGAPTDDGRHWGDSVGLFSYRTIIEQTGKGGCDDRQWLLGNIELQVECAYQRYKGRGNMFNAWSMYTNGRWREAIGK